SGTGLADVATSSPFYVDIVWLVDQAISKPGADGNFGPGNPVSRSAMAAFLYRSAGSPAYTAPTSSPFSDVATSDAFYTEMTWLAAQGITKPGADGKFGPAGTVSREAMAAFLYRFAGSPAFTAPTTSPFVDVATSATFYKETTWLAAKGITKPGGDQRFGPSGSVSREAMAAFLHRWHDLASPPSSSPIVASTSVPDGAIGEAYGTALRTADHRAGSWTVVSGTLPAGLALSGCAISGTPTTFGSSTFTVRFTDLAARTASAALTIKIGAAARTVVQLTSGSSHTLALAGDGTAWAWGANRLGELGDLTNTDRLLAVQVSGITQIVQVAAGSSFSIALSEDGSLWSWGYQGDGALGDGATSGYRSTPERISGLPSITQVAAGPGHALALDSDGAVWSWGRINPFVNTVTATPEKVSGLPRVVQVTAGGGFSLALAADGTVWAWGDNGSGNLGDGTTSSTGTPVEVPGLTGITQVAAGGSHSLALGGDKTVWAWGSNSFGQLGYGSSSSQRTPVRASGLTGVVQVAAGSQYSLALTQDGGVWAWGYNYYGALGDGTVTNRSTPERLSGPTGVTQLVATSSSYSSFALSLTGEPGAWAWGRGSDGQLGDGGSSGRLSPVRLPALPGS
ncbi:MAG: S-layer homology domain-containing protein, partial [Actinobacteria bacterium]|nr:S-layer homology domain-containing protein [Actinomycetota bacterium]